LVGEKLVEDQMDDYDEIMRAFAHISSIKENIPKGYEVSEDWVVEYHNALEKVEKTVGKNFDDFKVPDKSLRHPSTIGGITRAKKEMKGFWCDRSILLQKVDAVLTYLQLLLKPMDKKIGFRE
jgi:hypothetical protein